MKTFVVIIVFILFSTALKAENTVGPEPEDFRKQFNYAKPILGPINLKVSDELVNSYTGQITTNITLLPGVALSYSSTNVPLVFTYENRVSQVSWIGMGWNLSLGSVIADLKGTTSSADDIYYYNGAQIVADGDGNYCLQNNPYVRIEFSKDESTGLVTGITIKQPDGTVLKFGDFQVGYGPKKANRCKFYWGDKITDMVKYAGAGLICYRWDLSQILDHKGNVLLNIYYYQEQEAVTMEDGTKYYTRASYPDYIINEVTGQKIDFILGTRESNEWEDVDPNPYRIEYYEKKFLDKIEVLPDENSSNPILTLDFGYEVVNNNGQGKRLLKSITQLSNNKSYPGIKFNYDSEKEYILSNIENSEGATTQITSQSFSYTISNPETLIPSSGTAYEDRCIASSSGTTIATYDTSDGYLRIRNFIGKWIDAKFEIGNNSSDGSYVDNVNLAVSDNSVAVGYKKGKDPENAYLEIFVLENNQWVQKVDTIETEYNRVRLEFSKDGSHLVAYFANSSASGSNPKIMLLERDNTKKDWITLDEFIETGISNSNDWPLKGIEIVSNMIHYYTNEHQVVREWKKTENGLTWNILTHLEQILL